MSARVVLTSAPTAETMARVSALMLFAALTAAGHEATARGVYEPAKVTRRADALVAGWVYDVRYARPMDERTARMLAVGFALGGIECRVGAVSQ